MTKELTIAEKMAQHFAETQTLIEDEETIERHELENVYKIITFSSPRGKLHDLLRAVANEVEAMGDEQYRIQDVQYVDLPADEYNSSELLITLQIYKGTNE